MSGLLCDQTCRGRQVKFELTVRFCADVYGSYRQRLALVFPHHAPMLCWLQACVAPQTAERQVEQLRDQLSVSERGWSDQHVTVGATTPAAHGGAGH